MLVYLVVIGLWCVGWYFLPVSALFQRPLGSFTLGELLWRGSLFVLYGWIGLKMLNVLFDGRPLFAEKAEGRLQKEDWEDWGRAGLWLVGAALAAGLWLAYRY